MRTVFCFSMLATLAIPSAFLAADWPNWRGPQLDGISQETAWSPRFERGARAVSWTKHVGIGYSTVSVRDGRAYTTGWENGGETLYCLDAETGQTKWSHTHGIERYDRLHDGGSGGTPAVSGGMVIYVNRNGELLCLKAIDGKVVWKTSLAERLGVDRPQFGFAGSPVIVDDSVYVDLGFIVKLDLESGEVKWKTKNYKPAYSTPVPFAYENESLLACFPEFGLVLLNADNGTERASVRWKTEHGINAATPVVSHNRFFISSGYNTGGAVFEWDRKDLHPVWENHEIHNHMASCVLIDGYLYGFDESVLKCVDFKTGKQAWSQRGLGKGSLSAADGKLIVLSEKGELLIARAYADGFTEVSRMKVLDGDQNWVVPVLANGRIYCRSPRGKLVCVDVSLED